MPDYNDTDWDSLSDHAKAARNASTNASALSNLRSARDAVDRLIDTALAEAVVREGSSIRSAASAAGYTENAIRPRLQRSPLIEPFVVGSTMSYSDITRARDMYERQAPEVDPLASAGQIKQYGPRPGISTERPQMKFTPRRKNDSEGEVVE